MSPTEPVSATPLEEQPVLTVAPAVAAAVAEEHGVCTRPLVMRRIDTATGREETVPVACGSTRENHYVPCAEKAAGSASNSAGRAGTSTRNPT